MSQLSLWQEVILVQEVPDDFYAICVKKSNALIRDRLKALVDEIRTIESAKMNNTDPQLISWLDNWLIVLVVSSIEGLFEDIACLPLNEAISLSGGLLDDNDHCIQIVKCVSDNHWCRLSNFTTMVGDIYGSSVRAQVESFLKLRTLEIERIESILESLIKRRWKVAHTTNFLSSPSLLLALQAKYLKKWSATNIIPTNSHIEVLKTGFNRLNDWFYSWLNHQSTIRRKHSGFFKRVHSLFKGFV